MNAFGIPLLNDRLAREASGGGEGVGAVGVEEAGGVGKAGIVGEEGVGVAGAGSVSGGHTHTSQSQIITQEAKQAKQQEEQLKEQRQAVSRQGVPQQEEAGKGEATLVTLRRGRWQVNNNQVKSLQLTECSIAVGGGGGGGGGVCACVCVWQGQPVDS